MAGNIQEGMELLSNPSWAVGVWGNGIHSRARGLILRVDLCPTLG